MYEAAQPRMQATGLLPEGNRRDFSRVVVGKGCSGLQRPAGHTLVGFDRLFLLDQVFQFCRTCPIAISRARFDCIDPTVDPGNITLHDGKQIGAMLWTNLHQFND